VAIASAQKNTMQSLKFLHASCRAHHSQISSLHDAIFLGSIRCCELPLHTVLCTMHDELFRVELAASVGPKIPQLVTCLCFRSRLVVLDCFYCILGSQHLQPHVSANIIDKHDEVAISTGCCQRNWSVDVSMDKL
jgi:hypothetical protein